MAEAKEDFADLTKEMVRDYLAMTGVKPTPAELSDLLSRVRMRLQSEAIPGVEAIAAETKQMVQDYIDLMGKTPTLDEYVELVSSVRAKLEDQAVLDADAGVELNSAPGTSAAPEPAEASGPEVAEIEESEPAEGPETIEGAVVSEPERAVVPMAPAVGPWRAPWADAFPEMKKKTPFNNEVGVIRKSFADGLLKEEGVEYRDQRDALKKGPYVPPEESIKEGYIVCLEDGYRMKFLRRHLRTYFGMSVEEYLDKWGLPADYPIVAPGYRKSRKVLARKRKTPRKVRQTA